MPRRAETDHFTVTLPVHVIAMLEELALTGLYGSSRGEVARTLILSRLEQLASQGIVEIKRPPGG